MLTRIIAAKLARLIWNKIVYPNYDDSFLPNWLFDCLYDLSGRLEHYADGGK